MKNKGNEQDIIVSNEDVDLIQASKYFINILEQDIKKYKSKFEEELFLHNKFQEDKNYYFTSEKLSKKSPLTILNAPWGSGKTFFIENIAELFIKKEISSEVFKKIIIIDAWKFSNSKDVPIEFIEELSRILVKMNDGKSNNNVKHRIFKKLLSKMAPTSLAVGYNDFMIKAEWKKESSNEDEKEIKNLWELINNNKEQTIIFIDNLERLGSLSWDLLKSIIKLQEFPNYLIVLPLNLNKIKSNEYSVDNGEYPIEKYIDITMFNFKQDYIGYFTDKFESKEEAEIFNSIFSEELEGEKLSIREVDQAFYSNNIFNLSNTYQKIKVIYNKIWAAEDAIEKTLAKDVGYVLDHYTKQEKIIQDVFDKITESEYGAFLNFTDDFDQKENSIIDWNSEGPYWFNIGFDYEKDLKYFQKLILQKEKYLNQEIKKSKKVIEQKQKDIKQEMRNIQKQEKDIVKYQKTIENEESKIGIEQTSSIITDNANSISQSELWITKYEETKIQLESLVVQENENIDNNQNIKNKLFIEIEDSISEYQNSKKEFDKFDKEKHDDIISFMNSIDDINELFEHDKENLFKIMKERIIEVIL